MGLIAALTIVSIANAPAGAPSDPEAASLEVGRRVVAERAHRKGQLLLDFVPIGYANGIHRQDGFTFGAGISRMMARFAWVGAKLDYARVGFIESDSVPRYYHKTGTYRLFVRTGFGWGGRRVWGFATAAAGPVFMWQDISGHPGLPASTWVSYGIGVALGPELAITVHPNLSIGLRATAGWDFSVGGDVLSPHTFWFSATPLFRVHL